MPNGITAEFSTTFYVLQGLYFLIVVLGVVMAIDSQRAKRRHRQRLEAIPSEPLVIYALAGGVYAVLALVNYLRPFVGFLPSAIGMVAIMGSPVMFVFLVAYGLRVVFPRKTSDVEMDDFVGTPSEPKARLAPETDSNPICDREAVPTDGAERQRDEELFDVGNR